MFSVFSEKNWLNGNAPRCATTSARIRRAVLGDAHSRPPSRLPFRLQPVPWNWESAEPKTGRKLEFRQPQAGPRSSRPADEVPRGRVVQGLHEEENPRHRVRVEYDPRTLLIHLSDEDGAGWTTDMVLVNTSEDQMNGEVRFFDQGSGSQAGSPLELGIGDGTTVAPAVEYNIPPRSFQKIATAGNATASEVPFAVNRGASFSTPGGGVTQISGWASADTVALDARLTGLEILQYRQTGVTQSEAGVLAPPLRQSGGLFVEVTDKIRSLIAIVNPNNQDVAVDFYLTDDAGTSTGSVSVTVPASGQYSAFVADAPISVPTGQARALNFNASLPVFVSALRFFTNERNDSLLSSIPIADNANVATEVVVIPDFADGAGWSSKVILVNNSDEPMQGVIQFVGQGSPTEPPQGVLVGTAVGTDTVFEYGIAPHSFYRLETNGAQDNLSLGSIYIHPSPGFGTPHTHAIIQQQAGGNTIYQTSFEGQIPATTFSFYAEAVGDFDAGKPKSTSTAIAIANPSSGVATVRLELTSFGGSTLATSSPVQIPGYGQIVFFLSQIPGMEFVKAPFQGILRLNAVSGMPVTAAAVRVLINERSDYLVTPTGPLNESAGAPGHLVFPYITDSTGYTTQFVLINGPGVANVSNRWISSAGDCTEIGFDSGGPLRGLQYSPCACDPQPKGGRGSHIPNFCGGRKAATDFSRLHRIGRRF